MLVCISKGSYSWALAGRGGAVGDPEKFITNIYKQFMASFTRDPVKAPTETPLPVRQSTTKPTC
jgi:hypothetical protein